MKHFVISAALALAACSNPMRTQTDLDLLTAGIDIIGPAIIAANPSLANTVNTAIAQIDAADKALSGVVTATTNQSTVQQIVTDVQVLAPLAISLLPPGSPYVIAAQAVVALLPIIERSAGVVAVPMVRVATMSETEARMVLRGVR